jgi:YfiH family protein
MTEKPLGRGGSVHALEDGALTPDGSVHALGDAALGPGEGVLALGGGAHALFTARRHGNLSSVAGEQHEQGWHAREHLRSALGVQRIVRGYQVHGTVVGRVYREEAAEPQPERPSQPAFRADGHAVAAPRVAALVLAADCIPVVLAARGAVAALHAGWRGLAAGVLEEGVRALRDVGGEGPVRAVIGPCAGACCYEVGGEVHAALGAPIAAGAPAALEDPAASGASAVAEAPVSGRRRIDLRATARQRLLAAGVAEVGDVRACTICDARFFSHRREGARAGRQGALAWLA